MFKGRSKKSNLEKPGSGSATLPPEKEVKVCAVNKFYWNYVNNAKLYFCYFEVFIYDLE